MYKLTTLSLKNRALIALITIVAAVFGTIAYSSLKQELIPSIEIPTLAVITPHPGASAEVVSTDVSAPIEQALQTVPGLRSTTSSSSTGLSLVMAEFDYGIDTAKVEQKMTQSINRVSSLLPEEVTPDVMSFNFDDFPIIQIAVSGDDTGSLSDQLHDLAVPELERVDGVASASVLGAPGKRISITPQTEALAENGLSIQDLSTLLANYGILMPAGTIDEDGHTMAIQVGERLGSAQDIAAIPLPAAPDQPSMEMPGAGMPGAGVPGAGAPEEAIPGEGAPGGLPSDLAPQPEEPEPAELVTVGDVADVELTSDPTSSYSLVNGEKALTLSVTKTPDANTVEVSHLVQDALPHLESLISGATFDVLIDQAPFIEESISSLGIEGLLGLIMAVLVILLFLRSGRATLVTAVSIPTSLLAAFVAMQAAGYTLNMLSLGGLTIAIGRIVDDSIVVIENVERHMRYGKSRRDTIVDAVREVSAAITASTVTTIVVFLPIALVGGMAGVLFRPFAFTVSVAMGASLLVALTIVPVLAYWFLKWRGAHEATNAPVVAQVDGDESELAEEAETQGRTQRIYSSMLSWVISHRWTTVAAALVVLIGTAALAPLIKTSFLGDMGQNMLGISQTVAPGTSLDAQLEEAETVNDSIIDVAGVESIAITIGSDGGGLMMGSADAITYSLTTDPDGDQSQIENDVRAALDGVVNDENLTISPDAGMGMTSDVEISVTGADPDDVADATVIITDAMRGLDHARQVANSVMEARPTVSIAVDRDKAAELGLAESAVSQMVRGLLMPQQIGAITMSGSSLNVYLTPETVLDKVSEIEDAELLGGTITVADVATVDVVDGPVMISTSNSVRNQTVTITPDADDIGQTSLAVSDALDSLTLPDTVTAEIGGITQEQNEAFSQLGLAMLISILIVYVVMVATFRSLLHPLLLLVSVPFAATGAVLLQVATGIPLGVPSLIGVIMLIGIVVTNAIVLIDLVKQYRDRGVSMTEALMRGSIHRVRPILMTAIATILALLPMAIGVTGQGGFISRPLAIVVIGGLFSSTAMTLIVLPAVYHLVESVGRRGRTRVGG